MANKSRYKKMKKKDGKAATNQKIERMWKVNRSRRAALLKGDPSSCSDFPNDIEDKSTDKKDQDLCTQIKNSLKRLRKQEAGEAESDEDNLEESPLLNLEVFPDEAEHEVDTKENEDNEEVKEESHLEFHDESQTQELVELPPKPKIVKRKPVKRNPKRKVVIQQEINKSIIAARNAPALEKVFVNSINKPEEKETKAKIKRARLETPEIPSHFDHTEQLYEFGKHVAEQMMCFDEKDVRLAKAEIKEVLSKYRLKYKIMNCLSKPSNGESGTEIYRHLNTETTKFAERPKTKSKPSERGRSAGQWVRSGSQLNTGNLVTQSAANLVPQKVSVVPSLNELGMLNMNSSSAVTPLGFIIVPTMHAPGFHITTQRMDSAGSIVTQPLQGNSIGSSLIQPGSSHVITAGTSGIQPGLSRVISSGTSRIQPGPTHVISSGTSVIQPGSSYVISTGTSRIQPGSSHVITTGTGIQPGPSHVITTGTGIQPGPSHVITTGTGIQPESSHVITTETGIQPGPSHVITTGTGIQPGHSHVITTGTGIQPGPSHVITTETEIQPGSPSLSSAETSDTKPEHGNSVEETVNKPLFSEVDIVESPLVQPDNSEIPTPPVPLSHFVGYIPCDPPETLIVKCETQSDDET